MNEKHGFVLFLTIMLTVFIFEAPAEVLACGGYCPSTNESSYDTTSKEYTFQYEFDHTASFALQIDKNIECIKNNGQCENIRIENLNGEEVAYRLRSKNFVIDACDGLELKDGPISSYFLVVELGNGGCEDRFETYNTDSDYDSIPSITYNVIIKSNRELKWGAGNVVLNKSVCNQCSRACATEIPVAKIEISTAVQFLNLGPCVAKVRFDGDNNPLPFTINNLNCPGGVTPKRVIGPISNENIRIDALRDDGISYLNPDDKVLSFVNDILKGAVQSAMKSGDNSVYWTYIPGYGWILVQY